MTSPTLTEPPPGWQQRVRDSFARQPAMATLGAAIVDLAPGRVILRMPHADHLTQQHGFLHAGVTATLADSACGYAAFSLAPHDHTVLTVEFKINLLAPARGHAFTAEGRLIRAGRRLSVCTATVTADGAGATAPVAVVQATIMVRPGADTTDHDPPRTEER